METQPLIEDSFDVITLNIDDNFLIDPDEDGDLFATDNQQFDLATYIAGESSSSLLLSPPPPPSLAHQRTLIATDTSKAKKCLIPKKHFSGKHGNGYNSTLCQPNAAQNTVKTTANNRRKRKNLTREFIESSSGSDSDVDNADSINKTNSVHSNSKEDNGNKKKRKDDDPLWDPTGNSKAKTSKIPPNSTKLFNNKPTHTEVSQQKNPPTNTVTQPGNGLRNMLKKQLMSDRPVKIANKAKVNPVTAENSKAIKTNGVRGQPKIGLGRGKDIAITAKYYNCTESSDTSDRDINVNIDNKFNSSSSSESDSDSDADIRKSKQSTKLAAPRSVSSSENVNIVKEKSREQNKNKMQNESKVKINATNVSSLVNKINVDDNDLFAKAIVATPKTILKTKPIPLKNGKRKNLENQKRLIQSTMLLQNPAKFKIDLPGKGMPTKPGQPFKELKSNSNQMTSNRLVKVKSVGDIILKQEKIEEQQQAMESKSCEAMETTDNLQCEDMDIDYTIGDHKNEPTTKRKLNIQEYLERKSMKKTLSNYSLESRDGALSNIKIEKMDTNETKAENGSNEENVQSSGSAEKSMYEEIIIVSMGCNTNISIPAKVCSKTDRTDGKSLLLSNIQSTIEKVSAKTEMMKISSCSLISSIQDVICKKATSEMTVKQGDETKSKADKENTNEAEHGENKVIMHLRKDRVRPQTVTISVQTEPYFQFPPLERLPLASKKQPQLNDKSKSVPRDNGSLNDVHFKRNERSKSRNVRNYRSNHNLSESSYYSDEEDMSPQRRSRYSDFFGQVRHNGHHHDYHRRTLNHYGSSKYGRDSSRNRTISRSLSQSSESSTTSTESSSSSSSSNSEASISTASSRSLNSYGGSSSKSYYVDDYKHSHSRPRSNQSHRYRNNRSPHLSDSPGNNLLYFSLIEMKKIIFTSYIFI